MADESTAASCNGQTCKSNRQRPRHHVQVDKGWAWVVMGAGFGASVITFGQYLNSGIYFVMFQNVFSASRSTAMWIYVGQSASFSVTGLLANALLTRYGTRFTAMAGALTYASCYILAFFATSIAHVTACFAIGGAGHSLVSSSIVASMAQYFDQQLNSVTGIVLSGVGFGMLTMGLIIQWAEATYGWRGAMLIQAGVSLQICLFSAVIYRISPVRTCTSNRTEEQVRRADDNQHSKPKASILMDIMFWVQMASINLYLSHVYLTFQIMKDLMLMSNPDFPYDTIMFTLGISMTVGRLAVGYLTTLLKPQILSTASIALCALSLSTLFGTDYLWISVIGTGLIGLCLGVQFPACILTLSHLFGKGNVAILFGYNNLFLGVFTFTVPLFAGFVVDSTGSYWIVILSSMVAMGVSALLTLIINHHIRVKDRMELDAFLPSSQEQNEKFIIKTSET